MQGRRERRVWTIQAHALDRQIRPLFRWNAIATRIECRAEAADQLIGCVRARVDRPTAEVDRWKIGGQAGILSFSQRGWAQTHWLEDGQQVGPYW
ncbi:MAG: hypothetical protein HW416_3891, partial [Chloroflexi bacterium]|nr:hypothetical protein [Chloroflexota bacterium]